MNTIYIRNCRECPGCLINTDVASCYVYRFLNQEDLIIDLDYLDEIPTDCPMLNSGITFKIDPDSIVDEDEYLEDEDDNY